MKYVRKNDPVCTDGRPRTTPTDADRIKEEKTLDKIEIEVIKADYDKQIAEKDTLIFDETKKANSEREAKLKALGQITEHVETLKDKEHVIANLTTEITRLKEDRAKLREEQDNLREQISGLNVGIAGKDADIKHYKDQYDKYHRTYKELSNTEIMLKEQLNRAIASRDEESTNRAEANQRALNAEEERARIAIENAALMEKLATLQREIYDGAKIRADASKSQMQEYQKQKELTERNAELIEEIRDLKQKLSKRPAKIKVKG